MSNRNKYGCWANITIDNILSTLLSALLGIIGIIVLFIYVFLRFPIIIGILLIIFTICFFYAVITGKPNDIYYE